MRYTLHILILLCFFSFNGICQKSTTTIVKRPKSFIEELNNFIDKTNKSSSNFCKYYVYVVYVYPFNNDINCNEYTISYIQNHIEYNFVEPQYYYSDNSNLIIVNFNTLVKNKKITGIILNEINDNSKEQILCKLTPKMNFLSGSPEAYIYNNCGQKPEKIYFEKLDYIPKEKSIYVNYPFDKFEQYEFKYNSVEDLIRIIDSLESK